MAELELSRTKHDRRRFALDGIGTLRLKGLFSRSAFAEAGGEPWQFRGRGWSGRRIEAVDGAGEVVGEFERHRVRRGGTLRWRGRELELRPASRWRERHALSDGDRELAVFDGKGWSRRPVRVTTDDPAAVDPGLLLFAAFLVRRLAEDQSSAAAGAPSAGG